MKCGIVIRYVQLDPNGFCNSKCWFCPVAYQPNPEQGKQTMSLDTLDNILQQLKDGKGQFVDPEMRLIFTGHYNEVLLYKNFEEMLQLFEKHGFYTIIFSNGVALTKSKIDIIKKYPGAVAGILLNIPSYEPDSWSQMTGFNKNIFNRILSNLDYAFEALPEMAERDALQLVINGLNEDSLPTNGGIMQPLENSPSMGLSVDDGHMAKTVKFYKQRFPKLFVYTNNSLVDRAGYLARAKVMTNLPTIVERNRQGKSKVIGCMDHSGRTTSWIHINANADVFMCCDDYDFDTIYANIEQKTIKEIWESSERQDAIKKTYSTLCTNCVHAIWGD